MSNLKSLTIFTSKKGDLKQRCVLPIWQILFLVLELNNLQSYLISYEKPYTSWISTVLRPFHFHIRSLQHCQKFCLLHSIPVERNRLYCSGSMWESNTWSFLQVPEVQHYRNQKALKHHHL